MGLQQIGDFIYNLLSDLEWGRYICRLVLNAEVESPIVWIHTIILTHAESEGSSAIVQISMVLISQILHYWYIRHTVQEKSKQQKDDDAKWRGAKLYWRNPWDSSSDWGHSEKKKKKKKKRMMRCWGRGRDRRGTFCSSSRENFLSWESKKFRGAETSGVYIPKSRKPREQSAAVSIEVIVESFAILDNIKFSL
jgi:hypothetical protein